MTIDKVWSESDIMLCGQIMDKVWEEFARSKWLVLFTCTRAVILLLVWRGEKSGPGQSFTADTTEQKSGVVGLD